MHQRLRTRAGKLTAAAAVAALITTGIATSAAAASSTPTTTSPAKAAGGWLARQLTGSNHDHFAVTFSGKAYPDAGETADGVLAMDAAHVAQKAAARATKWLAADAKDYATGSGYTPGHYYPGNLAKLLLVASAQHADIHRFGGLDLVKELRATEQPTGVFANTGDQQYGSSTVAQSLALIALSHSRSYYTWPDARSIAWLVGQQCGDGGFSSVNQDKPAATCSDVDATAYAAQALYTVHSNAVGRALHWLLTHQNRDGGFGLANGKPSSNANSTALAVQALDAAGYGYASPLKWLKAHQLGCSASASHRGAVKFQSAYDHDSAVRATTQAGQALALKYLGVISKSGAVSDAPTLKC